MNRRRRWSIVLCALVLVLLSTGAALHLTGWSSVVRGAIVGKKNVADRVAEFGPGARARLAPHFARAGVSYPPARLTLVGLKSEKRLDVYAASADGSLRFIRSYPILAASGRTGPKLKRGDRQVPEGTCQATNWSGASTFSSLHTCATFFSKSWACPCSIIPEMPLLRRAPSRRRPGTERKLSNKVDFVFFEKRGPQVFFAEVKTDAGSAREKQNDYLRDLEQVKPVDGWKYIDFTAFAERLSARSDPTTKLVRARLLSWRQPTGGEPPVHARSL